MTYRRCPHCGNWFGIRSDKENRKNRVYCSNACRTGAYKGRRSAAEKMLSKGKTAASVAKALDMELVVVRRWQKAAKSTQAARQ